MDQGALLGLTVFTLLTLPEQKTSSSLQPLFSGFCLFLRFSLCVRASAYTVSRTHEHCRRARARERERERERVCVCVCVCVCACVRPCARARVCVCCLYVCATGTLVQRLTPSKKLAMSVKRHTKVLANGEA